MASRRRRKPAGVATCSRSARRPPRRQIPELGPDDRFADLTVDALRKRLRAGGFAADGTKPELLERLRANVARVAVGRHTRTHRKRGNTGG